MSEFAIQRKAGPVAQRSAVSGRAEFSSDFNKFRDLVQGRARPLPADAEPPELRSPTGVEGTRPHDPFGAEALDPDAPRRFSAEPERPGDVDASGLDPLGLLLGSFAGFEPRALAATSDSTSPVPDRLVSEVVRAIAWGGNQRRGAARIELGGERYGGTRLVVEVDGDQLWLRVDAPAGVDADELRARLAQRFESRGLTVRDG